MVVEAARTIGDADPRAEDEGDALRRRHSAESESVHQTRRVPYLARQLSVFAAKPAQGYP